MLSICFEDTCTGCDGGRRWVGMGCYARQLSWLAVERLWLAPGRDVESSQISGCGQSCTPKRMGERTFGCFVSVSLTVELENGMERWMYTVACNCHWLNYMYLHVVLGLPFHHRCFMSQSGIASKYGTVLIIRCLTGCLSNTQVPYAVDT